MISLSICEEKIENYLSAVKRLQDKRSYGKSKKVT